MEYEPPTQPEHEPSDPPRIWVGSLSDYNAGILHGAWIDAQDTIDDIHRDIAVMLNQSHQPGAEEYAIFDYEGFGPWRISEYESIQTIARVAEGISEHGIAFSHWAALVGTSEEDLDSFADQYLGHWESMTAYAEELVSDFGIQDKLDRLNLPFKEYIRIDIKALARDLEIEHLTSKDANGIHIWSPS